MNECICVLLANFAISRKMPFERQLKVVVVVVKNQLWVRARPVDDENLRSLGPCDTPESLSLVQCFVLIYEFKLLIYNKLPFLFQKISISEPIRVHFIDHRLLYLI